MNVTYKSEEYREIVCSAGKYGLYIWGDWNDPWLSAGIEGQSLVSERSNCARKAELGLGQNKKNLSCLHLSLGFTFQSFVHN